MNFKNIKFRAWHKEQKNMFDVLVLDMNSGEVFLDGFTVETQYKGQTQQESMWISVDEVELMMYTGQQDRHGKDIYEGDIVNSYNAYHVVYWNEDYSCFSGCDCDGDDAGSLIVESEYIKHKEIIGNKYENTELLQS